MEDEFHLITSGENFAYKKTLNVMSKRTQRRFVRFYHNFANRIIRIKERIHELSRKNLKEKHIKRYYGICRDLRKTAFYFYNLTLPIKKQKFVIVMHDNELHYNIVEESVKEIRFHEIFMHLLHKSNQCTSLGLIVSRRFYLDHFEMCGEKMEEIYKTLSKLCPPDKKLPRCWEIIR